LRRAAAAIVAATTTELLQGALGYVLFGLVVPDEDAVDVGLCAKGRKDLIGGFDGVEHDAADAFSFEVGEVGCGVVFVF